MSMPALFKGRLSIPVIGAPLFIISVPDLVSAQGGCTIALLV